MKLCAVVSTVFIAFLFSVSFSDNSFEQAAHFAPPGKGISSLAVCSTGLACLDTIGDTLFTIDKNTGKRLQAYSLGKAGFLEIAAHRDSIFLVNRLDSILYRFDMIAHQITPFITDYKTSLYESHVAFNGTSFYLVDRPQFQNWSSKVLSVTFRNDSVVASSSGPYIDGMSSGIACAGDTVLYLKNLGSFPADNAILSMYVDKLSRIASNQEIPVKGGWGLAADGDSLWSYSALNYDIVKLIRAIPSKIAIPRFLPTTVKASLKHDAYYTLLGQRLETVRHRNMKSDVHGMNIRRADYGK